jgi:hypothetical protein
MRQSAVERDPILRYVLGGHRFVPGSPADALAGDCQRNTEKNGNAAEIDGR